ncbi:signal peptidase I [Polymorphospora lycopeni]|uniref:Signal peptidase I n=1 Tax=Polymorphospora lycopeni TaxID=3140240 RepID=A0ABV5D174_9ACTN
MDAEDDLRDEVEPWRRRADRRRQRKPMPLWQELPLLLVVAFCLAVLIRTFLLQAFYIPSGSMEDTLLVGDRVLVNKVVYDMRDPVRGEVVVFRGTEAWAPQLEEEPAGGFFAQLGRTLGDLVGVGRPGEKDFIKRVIGVPGDRVQCCDEQGRLTVNGHPLDESSYVLRNSPLELPPSAGDCGPRRFEEVVVPPGQLFVMGDHRLVSQDARCQGPVPIDNVIGRAFAVVWPYSQWSSLSVPETFDTLPQPIALGPDATPSKSENPGGIAVVVPILGGFLFAARSRLRPPSRRRRLVP